MLQSGLGSSLFSHWQIIWLMVTYLQVIATPLSGQCVSPLSPLSRPNSFRIVKSSMHTASINSGFSREGSMICYITEEPMNSSCFHLRQGQLLPGDETFGPSSRRHNLVLLWTLMQKSHVLVQKLWIKPIHECVKLFMFTLVTCYEQLQS